MYKAQLVYHIFKPLENDRNLFCGTGDCIRTMRYIMLYNSHVTEAYQLTLH